MKEILVCILVLLMLFGAAFADDKLTEHNKQRRAVCALEHKHLATYADSLAWTKDCAGIQP